MALRILIVGEYSAYGRNLKLGFEKLGHNASLITMGDGYRKILSSESDFKLRGGNFSISGIQFKGSWIIRNYFVFCKLKRRLLKNIGCYDYILILNYEFVTNNKYSKTLRIPLDWLIKLLKPEGRIFLAACGNDLPYYEYAKELRYWPYQSVKNLKKNNKYYSDSFIRTFNKTLGIISGVIPSAFEYAYAYRRYFSEHSISDIPVYQSQYFPMMIDNNYKPNIISSKIVIFHGLTREIDKGTNYIREAFKEISEKYPDETEFIIEGGMPLDSYLQFMDSVDIVVDQTSAYGYGMNAVFALMKGKTVLSGNEPETQVEYNNYQIPVINILPDAKQISKVLEDLIMSRGMITEISEKSRKFTEQFHSCEKVAESYLEIFRSSL